MVTGTLIYTFLYIYINITFIYISIGLLKSARGYITASNIDIMDGPPVPRTKISHYKVPSLYAHQDLHSQKYKIKIHFSIGACQVIMSTPSHGKIFNSGISGKNSGWVATPQHLFLIQRSNLCPLMPLHLSKGGSIFIPLKAPTGVTVSKTACPILGFEGITAKS